MKIKAADDRQPDILALERLLERRDVPGATRKRIEAEIRQIQAGERAERDAAYILDLYFGRSPNWAIIHDLRIEVGDLAAQMDHVVINRLAQMWVCESKSFAEGVSVNEFGEWIRWWHGRPEGIPSPIEQNRRHLHLLERAFDDGLIRAPKRLGLIRRKPELRSLVLVSDNARIGRPKRRVDGLEDVVKAEQLKTRLETEYDKSPDYKVLGLIGKDGLEEFAREVAALHRPARVDWGARFGLVPEAPSSSVTQKPVIRPPKRSQCGRCGVGVSANVEEYCRQHSDVFGGSVYCFDCQKIIRREPKSAAVQPAWTDVLARYRTQTRLQTRARQAAFTAVAAGNLLVITPDSSGRGRTLTQSDFERALPLLDRSGRSEVNEASRNSSYVEAIVDDFRRTPVAGHIGSR